MKPIFDTGTPEPKKKKKATKAADSKPPAVDPAVKIGPPKLFALDRPWSTRPEGLKDWVGTGAAVIRIDVAASGMTEPEYGATNSKVGLATDERVRELICEVTDHKPVSFVRRASLQTKHEYKKKQATIELVVFEAVLYAKDKRLVFFDAALIEGLDVVWVVNSEFTHEDDEFPKGFVNKATNAPASKDVTLLVAPYRIEEDGPTYRRAQRKLGRKT